MFREEGATGDLGRCSGKRELGVWILYTYIYMITSSPKKHDTLQVR